jgi:hypothetical protein
LWKLIITRSRRYRRGKLLALSTWMRLSPPFGEMAAAIIPAQNDLNTDLLHADKNPLDWRPDRFNESPLSSSQGSWPPPRCRRPIGNANPVDAE